MYHRSFGENVLSLLPDSGEGFTLPYFSRSQSQNLVALRCSPQVEIEHAWWTVRSLVDGHKLYEGVDRGMAQAALVAHRKSLCSYATKEQRDSPRGYGSAPLLLESDTSHLMSRFVQLRCHRFIIERGQAGDLLVLPGRDNSDDCLVFWSFDGIQVPPFSRLEAAGSGLHSTASPMWWRTLVAPWSPHLRKDSDPKDSSWSSLNVSIGIVIARFRPGDSLTSVAPDGRRFTLQWNHGQLSLSQG